MRLLLPLALACALAAQDPKLTRLEFKVDPAPRLRPLGSAVLLVKAYGELTDAQGTRQGRIKQAGWTLTVSDGAVSKPFKYQGDDNEAVLESAGSRAASIFRGLTSKFTVKDAVVYHAPERPGKYRVTALLNGISGEVEIEVTPDAPDPTKAERWSFPPEPPSTDPYRKLAEHYAPFIAQEPGLTGGLMRFAARTLIRIGISPTTGITWAPVPVRLMSTTPPSKASPTGF